MPLVTSTYKPPFWQMNGHVATIVPSSFRKVEGVNYTRERIDTPDGDFLDLDWIKSKANKLVIISHGLEGSSHRPYVKGMAKYFNQNGWDILAWNCRSCSGEINRTARFYHHGDTADLALVVQHALEKDYKDIVLIGFSLGGSLTAKYIGEQEANLQSEIKAGVVFSVPFDLKAGAEEIGKWHNSFYRKRFIKKLEAKIKEKANLYPDIITYDFEGITYFSDFDERYTAPLHGFKDANDFYEQASAGRYIEGATVPLLICTAYNDPFLPEQSYPIEQCRNHKYLNLETPQYGGHVGFSITGSEFSYMEKRALDFVNNL